MLPDVPTKKPSPFSRLKAWIHKHPRRTYAVVAVGLVLASGLTTMAILWQKPQPTQLGTIKEKTIAKVPEKPYYSPLTGVKVEDQSSTNAPVTAIMIENSPDARPQSGLKDAEIVYEAIAEGGITRFLAIYQQNKPEVIGPVRSVRTYYVDWLTPFNASVAHVGGSAAALATVRGGGYRDIDQFFNASYYRRAADRYAPHNVYTSFTSLDQLNASKGYDSSDPKPTERTDDEKTPAQDATKIDLTISGPTYNPSYAYDAKAKVYNRSQAGEPHVDREAGQIQAKVVVAMYVDMKRVMEDGYRESITTIGNGDAVVFQNGHANKVKWHKETVDAQLHFTDADGNAFKLARGATWITAIPTGSGTATWK